MKNRRFRQLVTVITFLTLGYMFSGGDCGTDSEDEPAPPTSVAAPTNVRVILDQASGSFATVTWSASPDQGRSDFKGYRVVTYRVDSAGNILSTFRVDENIPKASSMQIINSIVPLNRYRSYVTAETNNNLRSDSVASIIYAPVVTDEGEIDEFQTTGPAQSGFGFETTFGVGTQYAYTAGNASSIDLHVRAVGGGALTFYSPDQYSPGIRATKLGIVGSGQEAYDMTELQEPVAPSEPVIVNNVYLLKLESGHYVKLWVKEIQGAAGSRIVVFEYKLQPIENLRVLKR